MPSRGRTTSADAGRVILALGASTRRGTKGAALPQRWGLLGSRLGRAHGVSDGLKATRAPVARGRGWPGAWGPAIAGGTMEEIHASVDFWEGVLGMPLGFENPNLDHPDPEPALLRSRRSAADRGRANGCWRAGLRPIPPTLAILLRRPASPAPPAPPASRRHAAHAIPCRPAPGPPPTNTWPTPSRSCPALAAGPGKKGLELQRLPRDIQPPILQREEATHTNVRL